MIKIGKKFVFLVYLNFFFSQILWGKETFDFEVHVEPALTDPNTPVSLKAVISSHGEDVSFDQFYFEAPEFEEINTFTSQSTSATYINSQVTLTKKIEIVKILQPKPNKTGIFKITHLELTVGSQKLKAPDITVEVSANGGSGKPSNTFNNQPSRSSLPPQAKTLLRAEVVKTSAYKGEQIIVSYYLYHQGRVTTFQVEKFPSFNGFLREDLYKPYSNPTSTSENATLNGEPYERKLLMKVALYPLQVGNLIIDPLITKYEYLIDQKRGFFDDDDDPFFGFFKQLTPKIGTVESNSINIEVLPIPENKKPTFFSDLVGEFEISAALDKTECKVGEPIHLIVQVQGNSSLSHFELPALSVNGLELYDSQTKSRVDANGYHQKIFDLVLVPQIPGTMIIPEISVDYFETQSKEYKRVSTKPFTLNVTGESLKKSTQKETTQKIIESETVPKVYPFKLHDEGFVVNWLSVIQILKILSLLLCIYLMCHVCFDVLQKIFYKKSLSFEARFKLLQSELKHTDPSESLKKILNFLDSFLSEKYFIDTKSLERDAFALNLNQKGLPANEILGLLDQINVILFSPQSFSLEEKQNACNQGLVFLKKLLLLNV